MMTVIAKTMDKIRKVWICPSIILMVLLSGCSALPDYAMPRSGIKIKDPAILKDAVTYRRLARSDFKAAALAEDRAMHADSIGAHTCVQIRPSEESKYTVYRARFGEAWAFYGSIESIRFEAIMLPGCSWWNPALPSRRHAYVLQHEQIHFAITELAARRLTEQARRKAKTFLSIHPTLQAVREDIVATIQKWIREANTASLAEHTLFDQDTSVYPDPRAQQWWFRNIEEQLAELQPDAQANGVDEVQ